MICVSSHQYYGDHIKGDKMDGAHGMHEESGTPSVFVGTTEAKR
jgi:hypothetical protein